MLRLVTGPFHPHLESALTSAVRELKAHDPFTPLAIVVPSDSLRDRMKRLFCLEQRLSLLNVHLLTFHQLALRLLSDRRSFDVTRLQGPLYDHELVHHLLRRQPEGTAWRNLAEMPGAWRALTATLKDLKEAAVDPERVADMWKERGWEAGPLQQPLWLLYRQYLETRRRLSAWDVDDLGAFAAVDASQSAFLAGLSHLFYYGFYDLTQVQVDLFRAVIRVTPTTLLFPLVEGHGDFAFAQKFFDTHIRGLVHHTPAVAEPSGGGEQLALFDASEQWVRLNQVCQSESPAAVPRVISAGSALDEVTTVAKDILGLVEERGYHFADIGVVARALVGYEELILQVFAEQGIPVGTPLTRSLAAYPYVKTFLQLLSIRASEFPRDEVLELLSSPFFRLDAVCPEPDAARPDVWATIAMRLGLTKGRDEWSRLRRFFDEGLPLHEREEEGVGPIASGSQVRLLWQTLTGLAEALDTVPDHGSWAEYTDILMNLSTRLLVDHAPVEEAVASAPLTGLHDVMDQLRRLDEFADPLSLEEYVLGIRRAVEAARCPAVSRQGGGVQVLDAMAARGVPFRALYIMGLNEKVFPRFIHEDAFLRDAWRQVLDQDMGYKIQAKLAGYEEERLLFSLLCRSARDELVLSYLRADAAGRPVLPSPYVESLCRQLSLTPLAVPGTPAAKFKAVPQFRPEALTEPELATRWLLERRVPTALFDRYPGGGVLRNALAALHAHETMERRLGDYDGLIGADSAAWKRLLNRGLSPSALERYARCPFQFLASSVWHVEDSEPDMPHDPIGPREQGTLVHRIFRRWMEALANLGFFEEAAGGRPDPLALLNECAGEVFADYEQTHAVGHAVVWEWRQQELRRFLSEAGQRELTDFSCDWQPRLFEHPVTGTLTVPLPEGPTTVPIRGRLDRVDWSPSRRAFRIIDYKFKRSPDIKAHEKNLALSAVQGRSLQAPLYLAMGETALAEALKTSGASCAGVWLTYLAPHWQELRLPIAFPGDAWRSPLRHVLAQSFSRIIAGIRNGHFFIAPRETECERCEFKTICRRTHQPTAWRARGDQTTVESYRRLRRTQIPDFARDLHPSDRPVTPVNSEGH